MNSRLPSKSSQRIPRASPGRKPAKNIRLTAARAFHSPAFRKISRIPSVTRLYVQVVVNCFAGTVSLLGISHEKVSNSLRRAVS
jgi:hypothetical protein